MFKQKVRADKGCIRAPLAHLLTCRVFVVKYRLVSAARWAMSIACAAPTIVATTGSTHAATAALVQLASNYDSATVSIDQFWVSEKYDGIRGYWNGKQLLTRAGNPIQTPSWFTADWPPDALDGELWIARGRFEEVAATVRDATPDELAWRKIRFMVFDLPAHSGTYSERRATLATLVARINLPWVSATPQWRVPDEATLHAQLDTLIAAGGEGLMLHRDTALYHVGRSQDLLKLKRYLDAEAHVVGHVPGQGKYAGMLGALEVRDAQGSIFRIGTGFTDHERRTPPPIGALITYRYRGLTRTGLPRFASFIRVRDER